ncbi:MAG: tRNA-queuosine alpha-mannosyltransferase domain-containing protein [bacterium]
MKLRVLFLEPFYGGSHRTFADGLVSFSHHRIDLLTLPARFWKWRMRGAALHFVRTVPAPELYDLIIVSDLMSLSDLKSLWGSRCPPSIVYFHESQLSYPLPPGERMDYHFGFTDITSCLTADKIVFNSRFHFSRFFEELPKFIRKMPEFKPTWVPDEIEPKSAILYPGCDFGLSGGTEPSGPGKIGPSRLAGRLGGGPLIVWNHRWEFDKNPGLFFDVLYRAAEAGLDFRLALLGENFQTVPKPFLEAKDRLGDRILHYGYVEDRKAYMQILEEGDIVISTSIQENFGYSVVEAIRAGCYPLLPERLSYPEILPEEYHVRCLYTGEKELEEKLFALLGDGKVPNLRELSISMDRFDWKTMAPLYDELLEGTAAEGAHG